MKKHLKVAITTNGLTDVDVSFAAARQIVFYKVTAESARFEDIVQFKGGKSVASGRGPGGGKGCSMGDLSESTTSDLIGERVGAMRGASVLFTLGLSDPQAVSVKAADIFPVKMEKSRSIDEVLDQVRSMLSGNPPLWVKRVLRDETDAADEERLALA
ncbi:MAG: nitrogen fixation protein [Zoogloea sp.]|nr:nitrogen fixation protein [Zoogloea sp.]